MGAMHFPVICAIFRTWFFRPLLHRLTQMAASTGTGIPELPEDDHQAPPPVYEVEEELVERRISTVPVPNDRRGNREPGPAPDNGKAGGQ